MAAKSPQTTVLVSPFKFGFFAGLGFFVASALMSLTCFFCIILVGLGTVGSMISAASFTSSDSSARQSQSPQTHSQLMAERTAAAGR